MFGVDIPKHNDPDNRACPVECLPRGIPPSGPSERDSTGRAYSTGINPVETGSP
jgi:hypothetical protein